MARDDRSPVVRLYLASALQRLDRPARWRIADGLLTHGGGRDGPQPAEDGLAGRRAARRRRIRRLALDAPAMGRMPLVARFVGAAGSGCRRTRAARSPRCGGARMPGRRPSLLEGMRDGLEGRVDLTRLRAWPATVARLRRSAIRAIVRLAAEVADAVRRHRGGRAQPRRCADDGTRPLEQRRRALQTLATQRRPELVPELARLLDDAALRIEAIRAIAAFDDESLGQSCWRGSRRSTGGEGGGDPDAGLARLGTARMLTEAIASGACRRRDVPPHVARQLRRVVGVRVRRSVGPDRRARPRSGPTPGTADLLNETAVGGANPVERPGHLRSHLRRRATSCTARADAIGPDLTGSNRGNLDYLLSNVLTPNAEVPDAYRMVVITTRDGQTLVGNVVSETDRRLTLRMVGRDPVVLDTSRDSVPRIDDDLDDAGRALRALDDREILDLVAYLRAVEQVGRAR